MNFQSLTFYAYIAVALILVIGSVFPYFFYGLVFIFTVLVMLKEYNKHKPSPKQEFKRHYKIDVDDPLVVKGFLYESHIGKRFEERGELVIYNGFLQGFEDGGVDLAVISPDSKTLNLIQCKNWEYMKMDIAHIESIYQKLINHNWDFLDLSINNIALMLQIPKNDHHISNVLSYVRQNRTTLTVRRTLYIASDKVVDLEVGKHLLMIKPNIFRYKDMKIVVENISKL